MSPAEEAMFRFQLSVITSRVLRHEDASSAIAQLIADVNAMLAARAALEPKT